tara:strand:- start:5491 stop:7821 length:2331 start_codon:yes stop_codon:yes gene_type:complete
MALGKNITTGRLDADQDTIMKRVRKPRFVDNAVRHGEYTKSSSGFTVNKPTQSDFIPATEKKYSLIEEEDTIRLLHNTTDGHRYEGAVYFDGDKVTTSSTLPALVVGSENNNQSLVLSKIEDATKGTRYRLENLKGRTLNDIGFTNKTIHFAQKIGVGLRTSDLAAKIPKATKSSINGVITRSPSVTFLAQDFYGVEALSALRYLSKHDGYGPRGDRYGNVRYFPQNQAEREYLVTENKITGGIDTDRNESVPNRIVVRGKSRANNHNNVVQIDDFGPQQDSVNEIPGGLHAPTAVTKSSAKSIGRRMLKMAKNATGSKKMKDVMASTHIHPGDMISYQSRTDNERYVVLGGSYNLTERKSDLHVNSVDATLEDVLQRFQEVDISGSLDANNERNRQFKTEEFSTFAGFKMKVAWQISERVDMNRGIGYSLGYNGRNTITGTLKLKSTGVLINLTGVLSASVSAGGSGYSTGTNVSVSGGSGSSAKVNIVVNSSGAITSAVIHTAGSGYAVGETLTVAGGSGGQVKITALGYGTGTTTFVTDGTNANAAFLVDNQAVYTKNGNKLGHIHLASLTTTATVIKSASVHTIENNEELFLLDYAAATATVTVADGDAASGMTEKESVSIISTDGTSRTYVITDSVNGGVATGTVLTSGSDTGSGTAGTALAGGIAVQLALSGGSASTQNAFLVQLKAAIEDSDGHAGKITVSTVPGEANGPQSITLTQVVLGSEGNTTITDDISQTTLAGFTGGGSYPEARNYNLKLGISQSNYMSNRRG